MIYIYFTTYADINLMCKMHCYIYMLNGVSYCITWSNAI